MAFLKPQSPLVKGNDYFYPLTTADQVIMDGGYRLDQIVGKVEKSTITLYQNGWSAAAPYSYSITVKGLTDDLNMQVFPHYSDDFAEKQALKEEFAKVSFCSRQGNIVTFECWDEVPSIDIDVDIEINVMYPIEMALNEEAESRLPKLNYSIVGGLTEPSNPTENMIWVNTDQPITGHTFEKEEPLKPYEGIIWIQTGEKSTVKFDKIIINNVGVDKVYPLVAKQYIQGEWIYKNAKTYQNNSWVEWILDKYLYNAGNEYIDLTGGWVGQGMAWSPDLGDGYNPSITRGGSSITATNGSYNRTSIFYAAKSVDLSGYSTLKVQGTFDNGSNGNDNLFFGVWTKIDTYITDNRVAWANAGANSTLKEFSIDISDLTGEHFIGFGWTTHSYNHVSSITMTSCELLI